MYLAKIKLLFQDWVREAQFMEVVCEHLMAKIGPISIAAFDAILAVDVVDSN